MIGKLSNAEIEEVLQSSVLGRIGCRDDDKIYVVPVNYVYDGRNIIAHSAVGMKIEMMRRNPQVCFEVDEMKSFTNWKSVIAWGKYHELTDAREKLNAMKLFVEHTIRHKFSETAILPEMHNQNLHRHMPGPITPVIYRIILLEKTGRYESA